MVAAVRRVLRPCQRGTHAGSGTSAARFTMGWASWWARKAAKTPAAVSCSMGTENSVRKITSAAAWLVSGSTSISVPAWAARRRVAETEASHMAGRVWPRRPPSKAGSMMRRCRSHSEPLVTKTDWPSSGASPSRRRLDLGKSRGRACRTSRTSAGSLQTTLRSRGLRNSAIQAR